RNHSSQKSPTTFATKSSQKQTQERTCRIGRFAPTPEMLLPLRYATRTPSRDLPRVLLLARPDDSAEVRRRRLGRFRSILASKEIIPGDAPQLQPTPSDCG